MNERGKAPTPNQIIAIAGDLYVDCHRCLTLVPLDRLVAAGKGDTPVDQLTFRCTRCGGCGTPYVHGPGNSLLGPRHLWPPRPETS